MRDVPWRTTYAAKRCFAEAGAQGWFGLSMGRISPPAPMHWPFIVRPWPRSLSIVILSSTHSPRPMFGICVSSKRTPIQSQMVRVKGSMASAGFRLGMLVPQVAQSRSSGATPQGGHTRTHLARSGGCTSAACILQSVSVRPGVFVPSNVQVPTPIQTINVKVSMLQPQPHLCPFGGRHSSHGGRRSTGFVRHPGIRLAVAVAVRSSSGFGPPAPAPCRRPQSIPACGCSGAAGRPGKARSHGFIGIDVREEIDAGDTVPHNKGE